MNSPQLTLAYVAHVDIGERQDLGRGALGERFLIPILGGEFEGEHLHGRVLPGGADRQWLRPDGVKELDALYEMCTHDGGIITVRNRVLIDESASGGRYARSVVQLRTTCAAYEWVNRRVFVGTLQSLKPQRQGVRISVYQLG